MRITSWAVACVILAACGAYEGEEVTPIPRRDLDGGESEDARAADAPDSIADVTDAASDGGDSSDADGSLCKATPDSCFDTMKTCTSNCRVTYNICASQCQDGDPANLKTCVETCKSQLATCQVPCKGDCATCANANGSCTGNADCSALVYVP